MKNDLLQANAIVPSYSREQLKTRIVHLGFGAFHRAHQAVYADQLAADHQSDWGYGEVNLIGGEQQILDLRHQHNLFSVAEMSEQSWQCRVVAIVREALHVQLDGLDRVMNMLCQPDVAIVSLTITEKGYCHHPASGRLDLDHPLIAHDIEHPQQPQSAAGVIVAALAQRRELGLPAFTVMSCDNMPENGHVTHDVSAGWRRRSRQSWRNGLSRTSRSLLPWSIVLFLPSPPKRLIKSPFNLAYAIPQASPANPLGSGSLKIILSPVAQHGNGLAQSWSTTCCLMKR